MAETILNNPIILRGFILYEFRDKKPIFDAYRHFCKVLGDETMEYQEFEFWFMRFENGKFDLDYDRSKDPKTRTFMELPVNLLMKVFKECPVELFPTIRQVSKPFRLIIDQAHIKSKIHIKIADRATGMRINGKTVIDNLKRNRLDEYYLFGPLQIGHWMIGQHLFPETIRKIVGFIKSFNPNYHKFEEFKVSYAMANKEPGDNRENSETAQEMFKELRPYIKSVRIENWKDPVSYLQLLEPGVLEEIYIREFKKEVVNLEQWKMAKNVTVDLSNSPDYEFKVEDFMRFPRVELRCKGNRGGLIEAENTLFQLPHFEKYVLVQYYVKYFIVNKEYEVKNQLHGFKFREEIGRHRDKVHIYSMEENGKVFEVRIEQDYTVDENDDEYYPFF